MDGANRLTVYELALATAKPATRKKGRTFLIIILFSLSVFMEPLAVPYTGRHQAGDSYSVGKILLTRGDTNEMEKRSVAMSVARVKKVRNAGQRGFANVGRITEPLQPSQFALPTEPGDLSLGVVARVALRIENRIAQAELALYELHRLFVSVGFERLARRRGLERENAS